MRTATILLFLALASTTHADTFFDIPGDYPTLVDALNDELPPDSVLIITGTQVINENTPPPDVSVTILGGSDDATIELNSALLAYTEGTAMTIRQVQFSGTGGSLFGRFSIEHCTGFDAEVRFALMDPYVTGCHFENCGRRGLPLIKCLGERAIITYTTIVGSPGVGIEAGDGVFVGNNIEGCGEFGMTASSDSKLGAVIIECSFDSNEWGLMTFGTASISNCQFNRNRIGGYLSEGLPAFGQLQNCEVSENGEWGAILQGTGIIDSHIHSNGHLSPDGGYQIYASNNEVIDGCVISGCAPVLGFPNLGMNEIDDSTCPACHEWDITDDGAVGIQDVTMILAEWATPTFDFDGDGSTGLGDLITILSAWGPCPL